MRRWAIWAANIALFVACCFLAAGIFDQVVAEVLLPTRAEVAPSGPIETAGKRSWSDRESILARNLFGAKLTGAQDEPPPVVEEDIEETKLPLKLLGTVAGEDESVSNAAIQDLGTRKHQVVFIGDALSAHPSYKIAAIERKRVVLSNGPKREELSLGEDVTPAPAARGRNTRTRPPRRTRRRADLGDKVKQLQKEVREGTRSRTTAALYSQARIVPKWQDGQMVGVQLNQVKPNSLYQKIGIKSGDVITSLNGIDIDSPQASSKLLTEFTQADEFRIELQGGRSIDVDPSRLEELLEENES